jgi:hypothetical protein
LKEEAQPLRQVSYEEILVAQKKHAEAKEKEEKQRNKALFDRGFSIEWHNDGDLY